VQPVALPPAGQVSVPFVDGGVGAGPQQALGEAQAAEAAADHRHPKTGHALYHVGWPASQGLKMTIRRRLIAIGADFAARVYRADSAGTTARSE
jgi:hypothetical protein